MTDQQSAPLTSALPENVSTCFRRSCVVSCCGQWTAACWQAMQPFVPSGVYVNFLDEEGTDRVRAAYGPNDERLAALKTKYDPTNPFRCNQNVPPAT